MMCMVRAWVLQSVLRQLTWRRDRSSPECPATRTVLPGSTSQAPRFPLVHKTKGCCVGLLFEHYRSCCFSKFQCNNLVSCHHKCAVVYVSATVKPGAASATLVLKDSRSRLVVSMARAPVDRYKAEARRTSKKLFSTRSPACLVFSTRTCLLLMLLLLLWCCFASDSVIFKPRRDHQPRQTSRKGKIDWDSVDPSCTETSPPSRQGGRFSYTPSFATTLRAYAALPDSSHYHGTLEIVARKGEEHA